MLVALAAVSGLFGARSAHDWAAPGVPQTLTAANNTPGSIFNDLVELGEGRVLGHHALQFWAPHALDRDEISRILEPVHAASSLAFQRLESRFRKWYRPDLAGLVCRPIGWTPPGVPLFECHRHQGIEQTLRQP